MMEEFRSDLKTEEQSVLRDRRVHILLHLTIAMAMTTSTQKTHIHTLATFSTETDKNMHLVGISWLRGKGEINLMIRVWDL